MTPTDVNLLQHYSRLLRIDSYINTYCTRTPFKSYQTFFVTCAEYNKCRPYSETLTGTYKPLTNSAVQEELRKYLPGGLK
jgi:hypothetical protein